MPDSFTTNLELRKPEVGASRDTWGATTNGNWDVVDEFIAMSMPIGAVLDFAGPNAPPGWLICDGRLISRTTYSHLFAVLGTHWGAGDGSTTFALPNTPGRSSVGPGTVTDAHGLAVAFTFAQRAGVVNNYIQKAHLPNITLTAGANGAHNHTGSVSTVGDHTHTGVTVYTGVEGNHQHSIPNSTAPGAGSFASGPVAFGGYSVTSVDGEHQHTLAIDPAGGHSHIINTDGSHNHLIPLGGSGTAFSVLSPVIVVTKIIYAGAQAAPALSTMTLDATPTRRRLSAPMRGSH